MSGVLYESLVEKWSEYLEDHLLILDYVVKDEDVDEEYHELVSDFCKNHGYSERTKNYFFDRWYDTFADMYFQKLEVAGVKIIYSPASLLGIEMNRTLKEKAIEDGQML